MAKQQHSTLPAVREQPAEERSTSTELSVSTQTGMARAEVEGAIIVARKFPRNEDSAYQRVIKSCGRPSFAEMAKYSYPRGSEQISGASVQLAREIARCWGNLRYGADVVNDDEESRTIRGWCWDVETNTRESQDVTFKKLVYRKGQGWIKPDERDLFERNNSLAARCVRNCILHLVPPDLVEDALVEVRRTMESDVANDPDEARKKLLKAFSRLGVTAEELEKYLKHPIKQASAKEIADLRAIWKSINDGNSTWKEYLPASAPTAPEGGAKVEDLTGEPKKVEEKQSDTMFDSPPPNAAGEGY